jgi:pimeloyl-ACP methyl ester carboxylesterase
MKFSLWRKCALGVLSVSLLNAGMMSAATAAIVDTSALVTTDREADLTVIRTQLSRADVVAQMEKTPVPGSAGCCHAIPKIDVTARLKEIKCPALVICGENDPGTPPAMAREIHDNLPGSKLVLIPQAAHLSNVEQPEAFNRALGEFLSAPASARA